MVARKLLPACGAVVVAFVSAGDEGALPYARPPVKQTKSICLPSRFKLPIDSGDSSRPEERMIEISIDIEGVSGLNWLRWKRLVTVVEQLGFAGLYGSDHFVLPAPPNVDSLELMVALTYLADHSKRLQFGSMVSPLSFRDPVLLTRQAIALDHLSEGRMILGVGAGWMEREHTMFGYELGDMPTRMDRLAEGLHVIHRLLRSHEPVTYAGQFYQLHDAMLLPRPQHPQSPKLLVGAKGPRRALPLVARYADIWNAASSTLSEYQELSARLDELLRNEGRQVTEVKRTTTFPVLCGLDTADLERRVQPFRLLIPALAHQPLEEVLAAVHSIWPATIWGTPDQVNDGIQAWAKAGVEELMIQWVGLEDVEGLEVLAAHVLPQVTTQQK
jgi:alkanesulfonate monooxygenase SsuD/methylene tetrahydromethanopterin reductase-like flavin-dependent oxidoreductase (luciferase family)